MDTGYGFRLTFIDVAEILVGDVGVIGFDTVLFEVDLQLQIVIFIGGLAY